jgi:hypothetical protein
MLRTSTLALGKVGHGRLKGKRKRPKARTLPRSGFKATTRHLLINVNRIINEYKDPTAWIIGLL